MSEELKEYVVTLHRPEDLDEFYADMETPGGNLHIPDRVVDVVLRRPTSKNTHYWLTKSEAEKIQTDPRVKSVGLNAEDLGLKIMPTWVEPTTPNFAWTKDEFIISSDKNWGLLRCTKRANPEANWGTGSVTRLAASNVLYKNLTTLFDGTTADVVITDSPLYYQHAEFVGRHQNYNWLSLNPFVAGTAAGTYVYPAQDTTTRLTQNDHGTHVAGTAAGNRQGWARQAKLYSIDVFGGQIRPDLVFDYIKEFHLSKPILADGYRRPTVVNASWTFVAQIQYSNINFINYRGTQYNGPWDFNGNGSVAYTDVGFGYYQNRFWFAGLVGTYLPPYLAESIEECIDAGVHVITAAGNYGSHLVNETDPDYNNYLRLGSFNWYYNRRGSLGSANAIVVGSIAATTTETPSWFSSKGSGVDIFAPGELIISSVAYPERRANPANRYQFYVNIDPRNINSDKIMAMSGTSMASPQVAGVLAMSLDMKPDASPQEMKQYILEESTADIVNSGTGIYADNFHIRGAENRYLAVPFPNVIVSVDKTTFTELETINVYVTGANVVSNTLIFWENKGTTVAADFLQNTNKGNIRISAGQTSILTLNPVQDFVIDADTGTDTETIELEFRFVSHTGPLANSISLYLEDASDLPSYTVIPSRTTVVEGNSIAFYMITRFVPDGTRIYWRNVGTADAFDVRDGFNSGSFNILDGSGGFVKVITADNISEGDETYEVEFFSDYIGGNKVANTTVVLKDFFGIPPSATFAVTPSTLSINESGLFRTVTFNITTTNVNDGTVLYWQNAGTTKAEDFTDGNNSGTVTINSSSGSVSRTLANDITTEGNETIIFVLRTDGFFGEVVNTAATVTVVDTSQAPVIPPPAPIPAPTPPTVPTVPLPPPLPPGFVPVTPPPITPPPTPPATPPALPDGYFYFQANVVYIVGLNNSRSTSVNVHRSTTSVPDVFNNLNYGPNDLDPLEYPGAEHYGIFIQSDFHTPVPKTVVATDVASAIALFKATYGNNSLVDTPIQLP